MSLWRIIYFSISGGSVALLISISMAAAVAVAVAAEDASQQKCDVLVQRVARRLPPDNTHTGPMPDAPDRVIKSNLPKVLEGAAEVLGTTVKALVGKNPIHAEFLTRIGFDAEDPSRSAITTRALAQVFATTIAHWKSEGKITDEDTIVPATIQGEGWDDRHAVDIATTPTGVGAPLNLIDEYTIHDQILWAADGKFAVGNLGFFAHDMGHLSVLLKDPSYMAAWRRIAKKYRDGGYPKLLAGMKNSYLESDVGFFSTMSVAIKKALPSTKLARSFKDRYIFATEWLVLFKPEAAADLQSRFDQLPGVAQISGYVRTQVQNDPAWLPKSIANYLDFYDRYAVRWGGAVNDAHNSAKWGDTNMSRHQLRSASPDVLVEFLRRHGNRPDLKVESELALTRLMQWGLVGSQHSSPSAWLEWAFDPATQPAVDEAMQSGRLLLGPQLVEAPMWNIESKLGDPKVDR